MRGLLIFLAFFCFPFSVLACDEEALLEKYTEVVAETERVTGLATSREDVALSQGLQEKAPHLVEAGSAWASGDLTRACAEYDLYLEWSRAQD